MSLGRDRIRPAESPEAWHPHGLGKAVELDGAHPSPAAGDVRRRGLLCAGREEVGHPAGETFEHPLAADDIVMAEEADRAISAVNANRAGVGDDDPNELHAEVQVFLDLPLHLHRHVAGRENFDDKIRGKAEVAVRDAAGQAIGTNDQTVRSTIMVQIVRVIPAIGFTHRESDARVEQKRSSATTTLVAMRSDLKPTCLSTGTP